MDHVIVFDLSGPYGHYRKNYSPVSPVTFPCPTPTALIGTIAGIVGEEKRSYLSRFSGRQWRLAISLLKPVKKYRAAINLINTKLDSKTFRPKGKSPRIQIPYEFLKDAAFRIYFWHEDENLFSQVRDQLATGTTVYTPSLGLAQCIADVNYLGICSVAPKDGTIESEFQSIVPLNETTKIKYEQTRRYQKFTMPVSMFPGRVVKKYQSAIIEESGRSIRATNANAFKCGDETISFFQNSV